MFWTDWGQFPKVERATLGGEDVTPIVTSGLHWPSDVAIDFQTGNLYWVDAYLDKVETADYNGKNRSQVFHDSSMHPFAILAFSATLYWTDWNSSSIRMINKSDGAVIGSHGVSGVPVGLAMYDSSRQPAGKVFLSLKSSRCQSLLIQRKSHVHCLILLA